MRTLRSVVLCCLGVALWPGVCPAQPPAEDPRDAEIRALRELVEQLQQRVEALEKKVAVPAPPPGEAPPPEVTPPAAPPAPTGGGGASALPLISAVGNFVFRGSDSRGTPRRGRFSLEEGELAFQDQTTPNMRMDLFVSAERGEDWKLGLEEGILSLDRVVVPQLSAQAGLLRVPFGRQNPLHTHSLLTVDTPAVLQAFLGPDGLRADGGVLHYRLPMPEGTFGRASLGYWTTASEPEDGLGFAGTRGAWSGRLFFSRDLGHERELEVGASRYQGRGEAFERPGRRDLDVNGVDVTYKSYPASGQRVYLQAELLGHHTGGHGTRMGYYLLGERRWNPYWSTGLRWDYTKFPWPVSGHESALSAWITRQITEQTSVRLQLKKGARPMDGGFTEILLQFLTGFGPHIHPLQ